MRSQLPQYLLMTRKFKIAIKYVYHVTRNLTRIFDPHFQNDESYFPNDNFSNFSNIQLVVVNLWRTYCDTTTFVSNLNSSTHLTQPKLLYNLINNIYNHEFAIPHPHPQPQTCLYETAPNKQKLNSNQVTNYSTNDNNYDEPIKINE